MITEKSCGAIVYTKDSGIIQYVIIRSKEGFYEFPKGHMEENETNVWEVSYDNGETWTSLGVAATGADGKDGETSILPIVISCISLAGMVVMFCVMMAERSKKNY